MISGLVVRLTTDIPLADAAVQLISAKEAIELGPRQTTDLPIVLETETPAESRDLTEWLTTIPGVTHVDVTFTCFDDELNDNPAPIVVDTSPTTLCGRLETKKDRDDE